MIASCSRSHFKIISDY